MQQVFEATTLKILILFAFAAAAYVSTKRSRTRLPPGPRGVPILGNVFQLDISQPWRTFTKWKQRYGPLVYVNMAGQPIVILSSKKTVEDLLDRRAAKYSDRPRILVGREYLTRNLDMVLISHTERWRKMRRASETALGLRMAMNYQYKQAEESVLLAHDLLKKSSDWKFHTHRTASSNILSIVYDLPSVQSSNDPILAFMDYYVSRSAEALLPGSHMVDTFPILDYLPDVLAHWRRKAGKDFQKFTNKFEKMFLKIKSKSLAGMEQRPSFCATLVETEAKHGMSDVESSWLAGVLYAAGQETSTTVLHWFLFIMLLFPEVQRQAQDELDRVVGRSRLPSPADMKHLPYIQAIVKEIVRWKPPTPIGVPHASNEDDYYDGFFIPKGTVIIPNVWHLNRDPEIYGPDADQFRPERHLDQQGNLRDPKDDGHFTFGFGQRVCVGRHVANNFLSIAFATILWALRIEPVKDHAGNDILPDIDAEVSYNAVIIRPPPFEFVTVARFEDVDTLMQQAREEILVGSN
ncbi:hypothetical protein VKT23_007506 [Stygiomarasmius scandens]|uniref:Cytochrome P450 n=1 Tax=Marasmiellus scandens TaxID=2682957 RepID=A0ABR1JK20_9AGAR